jgi:hypothetical protein
LHLGQAVGTPERLPNPLAPEETDETLLRASVPYGYLRQQMIKPLTHGHHWKPITNSMLRVTG